MPIVERTFTYRGHIKVDSGDLRLARLGKKTCTIRLGKLTVADELVNLTDGRENLKVKIIKVDNSRLYADLGDEDARMDGLESKEELDGDLRRFYGKIDPMQPMTIIYFKLIDTMRQ